MELIRQNPYHVIGILAGANQREIAKQKAKINAFQKVGKKIEFEADFDFIENPDRTIGTIEEAFSNIGINQKKLFNALFWFANLNYLDEAALNHMRSGNIEKAEDIWQKIIAGKPVSPKTISAYNNLGTLKLATAFSNGSVNVESLKEAVKLKTELITSESFKDFSRLVADETYIINQNQELETFITALLEEIQKINSTNTNRLVAEIGSIHPKIKSLVSEKLTEIPINNIERKIEQTKKERVNSPQSGLLLGKSLYKETEDDLTFLADLLGKSDLKYKVLADKLAKELLQCGIDCFKKHQNNERVEDRLGPSVMNLFIKAKKIAVGDQAKERISENIKGLQEWIDNAEERKKQRLIEKEIAFIISKIEHFQKATNAIDNLKEKYSTSFVLLSKKTPFVDTDNINYAEELVTSCQPKLQNIKNALGANDEFYLKISSTVVKNALELLVNEVNNAQHYSNLNFDYFEALRHIVKRALEISVKLSELDMLPVLKGQFQKNLNTLKSIDSKLNPSRTSYSSNSGCYIATMAYGSYDHPQVKELRKFRDEVLSKTIAGRSFIKFYYWLSPKLVKLLKGNSLINAVIRRMLNQFIKYIR